MARRSLLVSAALIAGLAPLSVASAAPKAQRTTISTKVINGDTVVKEATITATTFSHAGPYAVGIDAFSYPVPATTLTPSGYTTTADCWYPSTKTTGKALIYNVENELPPTIAFIVSKNPAAASAATYSTQGVVGLPAAAGTFPLVLFSHGFASFKEQSSFLMAHLAQWGFVACAPDHAGRDLSAELDATINATPPTTDPNADVQDLVALRGYLAGGKVTPLKGHVDGNHVVVMGHSAGGSAAERLASWGTAQGASGQSDWIKGWVSMAGESSPTAKQTLAPFTTVPVQPGLVIAGQNDTVVPAAGLATAFTELTAPSNFLELASAGHNAYDEICEIGNGDGGIIAIAKDLGISVPAQLVPLATDGCSAPDVAPTADRPLLDQVTVAAARHFLGFDASTAGFAKPTTLQAAYPNLITTEYPNAG